MSKLLIVVTVKILEKTYLWLPSAVFRWLAKGTTYLIYLLKIRKKVIAINLKIAFPEKSAAERSKMIKKIYLDKANLLSSIFELKLQDIPKIINKISFNNLEQLKKEQAKGRGVVLLTAHYDCFLLPAVLPVLGVPTTFYVTRIHNQFAAKFFNALCLRFGCQVVTKNQALGIQLRNALQRGDCLGVAADFNFPDSKTFHKFFNLPASFGTGAYRLALLNKAPIFFVSARRKSDRKYQIKFSPMLTDFSNIKTRDDRQKTITDLIQDYARKTEEAIIEYPYAYLWFNRRWKTQPPGHTSPYDAI